MINPAKVTYPLQFFCPAEDWKYKQTITTARELQLLLDVCHRMDIPYRLNEQNHKFFMGHAPGWKNPEDIQTPKPTTPASASFAGQDGKGFVKVNIIPQRWHDSCGQTAVAMAINTLVPGRKWNDDTVNSKYGYGLLAALKGETGKDWTSPDFTKNSWPLIEYNLDCGYPVLFAANGPLFSQSGAGHVLLIYQLSGENVYFADPNGGIVTVRTRKECEDAPPHPDGKWLMVVKSALPKAVK